MESTGWHFMRGREGSSRGTRPLRQGLFISGCCTWRRRLQTTCQAVKALKYDTDRYTHVHMHINMYIHSGYNWGKQDSPRKLSVQFDSNLPHETPKHHVKEVQIQQDTTRTGCTRSRSLSSTGKAGTGVMGSSWQWEGWQWEPHCILLDTTHRMLDRYLQHVLSYLVIRWTQSLRTTEFCFLSSVIPTEVVMRHKHFPRLMWFMFLLYVTRL